MDAHSVMSNIEKTSIAPIYPKYIKLILLTLYIDTCTSGTLNGHPVSQESSFNSFLEISVSVSSPSLDPGFGM